MPLKISNNATSLLSSSVAPGDLSISIDGGSAGKFPIIGAGEWFPVTVTKSTGEREIMRCTSRTGVVLNVTRAQEGTAALAFTAGDARVDVRLTAAAIQEIAIQDRIYSIPADMSLVFRAAPNRLSLNNAAGTLGTDILYILDTGFLSTIGGITSSGIITAGKNLKCDGYIIGGGAVYIAPQVPGVVALRPHGSTSPTGQFYIDTVGNAVMSGSFIASGGNYHGENLYLNQSISIAGNISSNGQHYSTGNTVINSVAAGGNIHLRPFGGSGHLEMYLTTGGDMVYTGRFTSSLGNYSHGGYYAYDGRFRGWQVNAVLSANGGNTGAIYFRPQGPEEDNNQTYILAANGDWVMSHNLTVGAHATGGFVKAGRGVVGRLGQSGAYTSDLFNHRYISDTNVDLWVNSVALNLTTTTCDYRIKQDVAPLGSVWDKIKALRTISYRFKDYEDLKADENGKTHWGFIAHELKETLGDTAVLGDKDGERLQSLDTVTLLAALANALQEAQARIEALEAKAA